MGDPVAVFRTNLSDVNNKKDKYVLEVRLWMPILFVVCPLVCLVVRLSCHVTRRLVRSLHPDEICGALTYRNLLPLSAMVSIRTAMRHRASPEFYQVTQLWYR